MPDEPIVTRRVLAVTLESSQNRPPVNRTAIAFGDISQSSGYMEVRSEASISRCSMSRSGENRMSLPRI